MIANGMGMTPAIGWHLSHSNQGVPAVVSPFFTFFPV